MISVCQPQERIPGCPMRQPYNNNCNTYLQLKSPYLFGAFQGQSLLTLEAAGRHSRCPVPE